MMPVALTLLAFGTDPTATGVTKAPHAEQPVWAEVVADPILTVLQTGTAARWVVVDDRCEVRPSADGKSAAFAAARPGRYRLLVVPEAGDVQRVTVVVGKVDPPVPPPPDTPPQSELGRKLQAAYDADRLPREQKLKLLQDTIELYRQAAVLAAAVDIGTTGELVGRVKDAARALGADGLTGIRQAIAVVLADAMPTDEVLTAELRATAAKTFLLIRTALQEVK